MPDIQPLQIDSVVRTTDGGVPKVTITCSMTAQFAADQNNKDTLVFVFHAHPLGAVNRDTNTAVAAMATFCDSLAVIARARPRLLPEEPMSEPE